MATGKTEYETDVAQRPTYHDGTPRKTWEQLDKISQYSWDRGETVWDATAQKWIAPRALIAKAEAAS